MTTFRWDGSWRGSTLALFALGVGLLSQIMGDAVRPAQAQSGPGQPAWVALGPSGPWRASEVIASTGWPTDPFLIARLAPPGRPNSNPNTPPVAPPPHPAARTRDGGQTWQPANSLAAGSLYVVYTAGYGRVVLSASGGKYLGGASSYEPVTVTRSTDDGDHWTEVAKVAGGVTGWSLEISPAVYDDGRLLLRSGPGLFESRDAGATWGPIEVGDGQIINNVAFSPNFALDRTIYLSAVTVTHYLRPASESPIYTAAEDSLGLLVSRDGGETWASLSAGLQVDGRWFRHVDDFAISPTFATDGTLYLFAWGPWPRRTQGAYDYISPYMALLRSQDRGESWQLARDMNPDASGSSSRQLSIVISPSYATDGVVMYTMSTSGVSAAATGCGISRSGDFGATWTARDSTDYGGCSAVRMMTGKSPAFIWSKSRQGDRSFWISRDLGASQELLRFPGLEAADVYDASLTQARDGTMLLATAGGVWALGPGMVTTGGRFACRTVEPPDYAAIRLTADAAGPWLGCPTGGPVGVRVREQRLGSFRTLWMEDTSAEWLELIVPLKGPGRVKPHAKDGEPWEGPPDRVLDAEMVAFEGGSIIRADSASLVVAGARWHEVTAR